jgi:O-antigen ligase
MVFLKLSRFFIFTAIFCIVLVGANTFFPFIGLKYYFFRTMVGLSLLFLLLHWGFEAKRGEVEARVKHIVKQPIFIAVSLFSLAFVLASLFAHDPSAAFWSNFERGEGGFQMIHYYLFFALLGYLMGEWKDWRLVFTLSIVAAICMVGYGYLGYLQIAYPSIFCSGTTSATHQTSCLQLITPYQGNVPPGLTFWGAISGTRFQGSLGNPAYVAPYLIFSMFYALYLWFAGRKDKENRLWGDLGYGSFIVLALLTFIFSQTRGAFIGLAVGVVAFFLYLILTQRRWWKWSIPMLTGIILLGSLAVAFRDTPLLKNVPGHRLLELNLQEQTIQTRMWTWGSAWQGWKERPIFGWGPENFSTVFDKYFDPRHFVPGQNSETWFDRAHSVIMDYLVETGIVGLVAYLSVFVVFYYQFFAYRARIKKRADEGKKVHTAFPDSPILRALLFALPIGYFLQGVFLFDVLPIYINLFLVLAFAMTQFTPSTHHERHA